MRINMFGKGRFADAGAIAVILGAGLVFASPAAAKSEGYSGPLASPPMPGESTPSSQVGFDLITKKNANGKRRPVTVRKFEVNRFPVTCADGKPLGIGTVNVKDIPVKRRRFTASGFVGHNPDDDTLEVSGQIPRKGPATGTFRWVMHEQPGVVSPALPCDSGVLSWSAEKTG